MPIKISTLLMFFCGMSFVSAQISPNLPADTVVRIGQLPNGFSYYIRHNNEPNDQALLHLAIKTGSLHEEDDQQGIAHFVEHMAFNGTKHFEKNTLIHFLERNGKRFGADLNAHTSFAETVYKLEVNTDSSGLIDTALLILEDWASGQLFDAEEIEKERGIVISEWRSRLSSSQRIQNQTWPVLMQNSRYAIRLPIGDPEILDTVHRQRLVDYYQDWYKPELMAIIAVGNFDVDWMENEIKQRFGTLPISAEPQTRQKFTLDESERRSFIIATDPEAPFTRFSITWQMAQTGNVKTYFDLQKSLIYRLHNSMLNQRIRDLKEKITPPYTFAYSGFSSLPDNYQTYEINGMAETDKLEKTLAILIAETNRAAEYGFTEDELARQKASLLSRVERTVSELDKTTTSRWVSTYEYAFLQEQNVILDREKLVEVYADILEKIDLDCILSVSQSWRQSNIQTSILSTTENKITELPDSTQWYSMLDKMADQSVFPYEAEEIPEQFFSLELPASNAKLLAHDTTLQVYHYQLENGVEIYLKSTDFENDRISFSAFSDGGLSLHPDDEYYSGRHTLSISSESGLGEMPSSVVDKLLQDKQMRCGPSISAYSERFSGWSTNEDLEEMFQLMYLQFTAPRFDTLVLKSYREKQKEIFDRIDIDPRSAYGRMLIDLKYDNHLRRPTFHSEEFNAIDLAVCQRIYAERFANAADFQFVFVGNIEHKELLELAGKYLGNLPANDSREEWRDVGMQLVKTHKDTIVYAGQTPKAEVNLVWHNDFEYESTPERYHFGVLRRLLEKRFREHLREDLAGVYGVRIRGWYSGVPDSTATFDVKFSCAPETVDTLLSALYYEIDEIAAGHIDPQDLENIAKNQLNVHKESQRRNSYWLGQIVGRLQQERNLEGLYPGKYEAVVNSLSTDLVVAAAQKYLKEAFHYKFVLLPESSSDK